MTKQALTSSAYSSVIRDVEESVILVNQTGGHNKIYVIVVRHTGQEYQTQVYWGRIGNCLQTKTKYASQTRNACVSLMNTLQRKKVYERGYQVYVPEEKAKMAFTVLMEAVETSKSQEFFSRFKLLEVG